MLYLLNVPSLSLSNAFPPGESFWGEGTPEVPGGLWVPLCKQTLKVGPRAWAGASVAEGLI